MNASNTKIVLLGTGNPNPNPRRSGPSVAILVNETPYIVDFGPGLVRQAAALTPQYGGEFPALEAHKLKRGFLTHLHSDHTTGYPDLILTPWVMERDGPLEIYGPKGTREMTTHLLKAYRADINYRLYGSEPATPDGWRVNVHEIEGGEIYEDENVQVEAFPVRHGTWPNAFGFRFTTQDKVIVISGDTAPCENMNKFSRGADMLIHEVYSQKGFDQRDEVWQSYHRTHHTSTTELAQLAEETQPGLVVLYHTLFWGTTEKEILDEIAEIYTGNVMVGSDLQVFA